MLVFGDSHVEGIDLVGPTLCVNPGSPTYPHNLNTQLGTLGFLDIDGARRVAARRCWQLTDDGAEPARSPRHTIDVPDRHDDRAEAADMT